MGVSGGPPGTPGESTVALSRSRVRLCKRVGEKDGVGENRDQFGTEENQKAPLFVTTVKTK